MTTEEQVEHDAGAVAEPLPQQEKYYRPPARFGNVPVARTPLGWDPRNPGFHNHYPVVNLPTQMWSGCPSVRRNWSQTDSSGATACTSCANSLPRA